MRPLFYFLIFTFAYGFDEKFDKFFSDKINFQFSYLNSEDFEEHTSLTSNTDLQLVSLYTAENEEYKCIIPEVELNQHKRVIDEYTGPQPFELLQPLFTGQCYLRAETYWSFEFCLGKHVRQFHSEKQQTTLEYFLGYPSKRDPTEFDHTNLPTIEYGDAQVPYYSIEYENGTLCDLNNQPRSTKILFVCDDESNSNTFISLSETQSCQYELVFATNRLCSHPAFRRPRNDPYEIRCFLQSSETSGDRIYSRPDSYKQFTNDAKYSDFTEVLERQAGLQNLKPTQSTSIFQNLIQTSIKNNKKVEKPNLSKKSEEDKRKPKEDPKEYQLKKFERLTIEFEKKIIRKPIAQVLDSFFDMDYCFVAGSKTGFKIEFCYRSKITIFEEDEETGERENEIILGVWNERLQRILAKEYPELVKTLDDDENIERVVNYYVDGETNEESGKESNIEVRMFCNLETDPFTALDIKMFFVEQKPGSFRLYLESGLFCSYMNKMDRYGIYRNEIDAIFIKVLKSLSPEKRALFDLEDRFEVKSTIEIVTEEDLELDEDEIEENNGESAEEEEIVENDQDDFMETDENEERRKIEL